MKNKFVNHSHISEQKFKLILKYFSLDYDATKTNQLTNISRKTINKLYHKIRRAIFNIETQEERQKLKGEIEIDESYFGPKRIRGKRGRRAKGKIPVKSYQGLVLNGYKHYRIFHHENEFARGKNHINGIESFWSFTKRSFEIFFTSCSIMF